MGSLQLKSVRKSFGPVDVLKGIDLDVKDGEFVIFVGPSGCGKSTLLRTIAGLEDATSGSVQIDGVEVGHVAPAKRGIAMVFQSYALYPHLTVKDNMGLGLKQAGVRFFQELHDGIYGRTIYVADPDGNKVELFEEPR